MVRPLRLAAVVCVAAAASAFATDDASACSPAPRVATPPSALTPRPTSLRGPHAYRRGVKVERLASANVVVHYTRTGPDALRGSALRDDNRNRVPDYVEATSEAAEFAIESYRNPGFGLREIVCDAQRDRRADIYLKRGQLGLALEPVRAAQGSFLLVSPALTTTSNQAQGNLQLIVAHELFHLVQFAYVPRGMPRWIAEGTANAMGFFGTRADDPTGRGTADLALIQSLDSWLKEPWTSIYDSAGECMRCYGGSAWWLQLLASSQQPWILGTFFTQLANTQPMGNGIAALAGAMNAHGLCLCSMFAYIVQQMVRGGFAFAPAYTLPINRPTGTTAETRLFGFAIHLVPIVVPPGVSSIELRVRHRSGADFWANLRVGGSQGRDVDVAPDDDPATVVFSPTFANTAEHDTVLLMVTNSEDRSVFYDVSWTLR